MTRRHMLLGFMVTLAIVLAGCTTPGASTGEDVADAKNATGESVDPFVDDRVRDSGRGDETDVRLDPDSLEARVVGTWQNVFLYGGLRDASYVVLRADMTACRWFDAGDDGVPEETFEIVRWHIGERDFGSGPVPFVEANGWDYGYAFREDAGAGRLLFSEYDVEEGREDHPYRPTARGATCEGARGAVDGEDDRRGSDDATHRIPGYALALEPGAYWQFAWRYEKTTSAQGSSPETTIRSGVFHVVLGEDFVEGGVRVFPVRLVGLSKVAEIDLTPRWRSLAYSDGQLLGSTGSSGFEVVFDARTGEWTGGGFFADYGDAPVEAIPLAAQNRFVSASGYGISVSDEKRKCEYDTTTGTICAGDTSYSRSEREVHVPGAGPVAYSRSFSYASDGGNFHTGMREVVELGLVESSLATAGAFRPSSSWERLPALPTARADPVVLAHDGKVHVVAGENAAGAVRVVDVYDPMTRTWSTGAPMPPLPAGNVVGAALGGRAYVFAVDGSIAIYDAATGAWSEGSEAPTGFRALHRAASAPDRGAVLLFVEPESGGDGRLEIRSYHPGDDAWSDVVTMDRPMSGFGVFTRGTSVYLVGGGENENIAGSGVRSYWPEAPRGNFWSTASSMIVPKRDAGVGQNDVFAFVLGGTGAARPFGVAEAMTFHDSKWVPLPQLVTARSVPGVAVDGDLVFVAGGGVGGGFSDAFEVLDTAPLRERHAP